MTLSRQEKKALSDARMDKAAEFQRDAVDNLDRGRFRTAVNRAYYAVMNAARSALILEGVNPETHDGVITMISMHFVRKGLLAAETTRIYKTLLSRRTDVDYGDFDTVDKEEATDSVQLSARAIESFEALRKSLAE